MSSRQTPVRGCRAGQHLKECSVLRCCPLLRVQGPAAVPQVRPKHAAGAQHSAQPSAVLQASGLHLLYKSADDGGVDAALHVCLGWGRITCTDKTGVTESNSPRCRCYLTGSSTARPVQRLRRAPNAPRRAMPCRFPGVRGPSGTNRQEVANRAPAWASTALRCSSMCSPVPRKPPEACRDGLVLLRVWAPTCAHSPRQRYVCSLSKMQRDDYNSRQGWSVFTTSAVHREH
jgi:hypothetical protein